MFIDNFRRKREIDPSFFYDYEADNEGKLKYVFWADEICRKITLCLEMWFHLTQHTTQTSVL